MKARHEHALAKIERLARPGDPPAAGGLDMLCGNSAASAPDAPAAYDAAPEDVLPDEVLVRIIEHIDVGAFKPAKRLFVAQYEKDCKGAKDRGGRGCNGGSSTSAPAKRHKPV